MHINKIKEKKNRYIYILSFSIQYLLFFRYLIICTFYEIIKANHLSKVAKKDVCPIFIIGPGRSGNTMLAKLMHENSGVCFAPENYTLWKVYYEYLKNINKPWVDRIDVIVDLIKSQEDFHRWENVNLSKLKQKLISSDDHTLGNIIHCWYIEYSKSISYPTDNWGCKTPNLTMYSSFFYKIFPESKYIFVVREYRDVIQSYLNSKVTYEKVESIVSLIKLRYHIFFKIKPNLKCNQIAVVDYESIASSPKRSINIINSFFSLKKVGHEVEFNNPDLEYVHLKKVSKKILGVNTYKEIGFDKTKSACLGKMYKKIVSQSILK